MFAGPEEENAELRAENEEQAKTIKTMEAEIARLSLSNGKLARDVEALMKGRRADDDYSMGSSGSDKSGISAVSNYTETGFKTKVNGKFYPIIEGPQGGKYTVREDGRYFRLTTSQSDKKVPVE